MGAGPLLKLLALSSLCLSWTPAILAHAPCRRELGPYWVNGGKAGTAGALPAALQLPPLAEADTWTSWPRLHSVLGNTPTIGHSVPACRSLRLTKTSSPNVIQPVTSLQAVQTAEVGIVMGIIPGRSDQVLFVQPAWCLGLGQAAADIVNQSGVYPSNDTWEVGSFGWTSLVLLMRMRVTQNLGLLSASSKG